MPWSQRWRAARSSSPSTDLEAVVPVVRKPAEARPGRWLLAHDEVHEPWSLETHRAVATHTRRQAPRALWLTRWEAAWNVISALLPLAYLWSLPLLARAGFCQGPAQWRWGPEASISRYINNPWAMAALGGACFFAVRDMWRFDGVSLKAEGYLPGSHPLEFGASRLALLYVQFSYSSPSPPCSCSPMPPTPPCSWSPPAAFAPPPSFTTPSLPTPATTCSAGRSTQTSALAPSPPRSRSAASSRCCTPSASRGQARRRLTTSFGYARRSASASSFSRPRCAACGGAVQQKRLPGPPRCQAGAARLGLCEQGTSV